MDADAELWGSAEEQREFELLASQIEIAPVRRVSKYENVSLPDILEVIICFYSFFAFKQLLFKHNVFFKLHRTIKPFLSKKRATG